ncbi:DUF835 domain-containing protein [Thermococcus sp. 9N3]|uniref:DUF835 domain-containing protein n=1 Tax=Thermococcus sp. 9N3 TaxID=163002 RepID=UPI00142FEC9A|nr:DUF835 domain-containing protein [Thermococcus sp. 9N3]NJE48563.1 DUF835 domain-containing protein [Thermococcus sp. 9N3]
MAVNDIMPFVSGLLVMIADLTAFALIMRVYLKRRRRSALFFSVAWIADFIMVALSASTNRVLQTIAELSLTIFAMLMFVGAVRLLEEESIPLSHSTLKKMGLMAPIFYGFVVAVYRFTGNADWALTAGVSLGVSGAFVFASGVLLKPIEAIYKKPAKVLYLSVLLFGLHLVPAALFGLYEWYLPIGFTLSTALTVMMAYSMYRLTSTREFLEGSIDVKAPEIHSGTIIVQPKEFETLLPKLENAPVLAFLRDLEYSREGWRTYFVTAVPFRRENIAGTLNPTELAKMTEITFQYLEETARMGIPGVVVLDCIEYLSMYNSWDSLMKFLSKLRDLVMVKGGTLILVIDRNSVEERLFNQLRKLLE